MVVCSCLISTQNQTLKPAQLSSALCCDVGTQTQGLVRGWPPLNHALRLTGFFGPPLSVFGLFCSSYSTVAVQPSTLLSARLAPFLVSSALAVHSSPLSVWNLDDPECINVLRCGFGSVPLFGVLNKAAVCGNVFLWGTVSLLCVNTCLT